MGGKLRGWVDCNRGSGKRCLALKEMGKMGKKAGFAEKG